MRNRSRLGLTAALILVLVVGCQGFGAASSAAFLGRYVWTLDEKGFGGLSSIEVSEDGTTFLTLNDRGRWYRGNFRRDAEGRISGVQLAAAARLRGPDGEVLKRKQRDSEGLAVAPDGTAYVSFEGPSKVWAYADLDGPARVLPVPPDFAGFPENLGLESLAIGPDGALYTMPEESGAGDRPFPVYRFKAGRWTVPFSVTRDGAYVPVGADFGPDGRLYLLERSFRSPLTGFSSRIRRFQPEAAATAGGPQTGEVLLATANFRFGNLEGLSIWRDAAGALRATMVADDNFSSFLRTEIVEYRLPD